MRWDFEKGLLAFMTVVILAGLGVIVWQRSVASELEDKLPTCERLLTRIGATAQEIEQLRLDLKQDQIATGSQPYAYLEAQMKESAIGIKFTHRPANPEKHTGYQDTLHELFPRDSGMSFSREAIARFLLFVEAHTTVMKLTRLRLDPTKGAADSWTPRFEITERRALTGG